MSILNEDSAVYARVRDLCAAVVSDPEVLVLKGNIDAFLQDAEARALFECVNKMGEELRQKNMAGMEPTESEIEQFDKLREEVIKNTVCHEFLQSRQKVDNIFGEINRYFGMTLELNRVPTIEEVDASYNQEASGGCCGGNGSCGDDCACEGECDKEAGECGCKH